MRMLFASGRQPARGLRAALWMALGLLASTARAEEVTPVCEYCLKPVEPFRIHGNTYYVGTRGLSSILITSGQGHILIDGGLPEMAPMIADQLQALGFSLRDVRLIVNSHAHREHAGGLADLARESGARLAMSPWNADALRAGHAGPSDPQAGQLAAFPKFSLVQTVGDGEVLTVGPLRLRAHFTPGHTPGGTSWAWRSCEDNGRCVNVVYADTLRPDAAPGFMFHAAPPSYPLVLQDFARSFAVLEALPCDIVLSPYPDIVAFWQRREAQEDQPTPNPYIEANSCRAYADIARGALERRLEQEQQQQPLPSPKRRWF